MNTENTDRLKSLFQEIKLDEPSADFESRLMQQVHIVAAKQNRKRSIISILSITFGIVECLEYQRLSFGFWDYLSRKTFRVWGQISHSMSHR